jgi:hypothetical protein
MMFSLDVFLSVHSELEVRDHWIKNINKNTGSVVKKE